MARLIVSAALQAAQLVLFCVLSEARVEISVFNESLRTIAQNTRSDAKMCVLGSKYLIFEFNPY